MEIKPFFDKATWTLTYVVYDPDTRDAVIIDPVLDYDPLAVSFSSQSVDEVLRFVDANGLAVHYVLETHAHADHISGSQLLKKKLGTPVVIGEHIRARKAVTANETFFNGHFPSNPVMPGVLQIEAMAQAGALLVILSGAKLGEGRSIYVTGITDCRFKRPVVPGDLLELRSKIVRHRLGVWKLGCEVRVAGEIVSMATVTATTGPSASDPELPADFPAPGYSV